MIPKIIHYCWLSDDPMPKESIDYINCWRSILPDYKFILWNRDFFDVDSVPWVKEAFSQKKYAFAADYIRLFAVYNYGGFYCIDFISMLENTRLGKQFWNVMKVLGVAIAVYLALTIKI